MSSKPKVLIVDDEPDVLLTLRMILESEGFDPSLAADGETALRRIDEERPDLVVLDIMMPVLDGWFVLAELGGRATSSVRGGVLREVERQPTAAARSELSRGRVRDEAVRARRPGRSSSATCSRAPPRQVSSQPADRADRASSRRHVSRERDIPLQRGISTCVGRRPLAE